MLLRQHRCLGEDNVNIIYLLCKDDKIGGDSLDFILYVPSSDLLLNGHVSIDQMSDRLDFATSSEYVNAISQILFFKADDKDWTLSLSADTMLNIWQDSTCTIPFESIGPLHPVSDRGSIWQTILDCMNSSRSAASNVETTLNNKIQSLEQSLTKTRELYDKLQQSYDTDLSCYMENFVKLLNTKKRKIKELQEALKAQEDSDATASCTESSPPQQRKFNNSQSKGESAFNNSQSKDEEKSAVASASSDSEINDDCFL